MSSHCDRDGLDLDSSSDQEADVAVKPAKGWRPGKDCGSFDGCGTPLVQVILANLLLSARRLGSALSKALLRRLLSNDQSAPRRIFADRIVAQMVGVGLFKGRRVYDQVRANDWVPLEDIEDHVDEPSDAQPAFQFSGGCTNKEERALGAMRVRVAEALHVIRKGRPDRLLPGDAAFAVSWVSLGRDISFASLCAHCGAALHCSIERTYCAEYESACA